jgi:hypothetical protein
MPPGLSRGAACPRPPARPPAGIGELIAHYLVLRCGMTLQQARERCLFLDSRGLVCKSRTGAPPPAPPPPAACRLPPPHLPALPRAGPALHSQGPLVPTAPPPAPAPAAPRAGLQHHKLPFAHDVPFQPDLKAAIRAFQPDAIIGVSTMPGTFDAEVVALMLEYTDAPIIFPLSNPTSKAECTYEQAFK